MGLLNSDVRRFMTYAERLSRAVMDSLLPDLVGVYLHGSLALDDFVAGASDIDLCVVVHELRDDQRERLVDAVSPGLVPIEGGGFDLHVVTLKTTSTTGLAPVWRCGQSAYPTHDEAVPGITREPCVF